MDVLTFLHRVAQEREEYASLIERVDELRSTLLPAGIRYDKDKVQTSPIDRMPEVEAQIDEIIGRNRQHLKRLASDMQKAQLLIQSMEDAQHRQLLTLRYLTGTRTMSWDSIAKEMGYSVDHVKGYLHREAIADAREVWKKVNTH